MRDIQVTTYSFECPNNTTYVVRNLRRGNVCSSYKLNFKWHKMYQYPLIMNDREVQVEIGSGWNHIVIMSNVGKPNLPPKNNYPFLVRVQGCEILNVEKFVICFNQ